MTDIKKYDVHDTMYTSCGFFSFHARLLLNITLLSSYFVWVVNLFSFGLGCWESNAFCSLPEWCFFHPCFCPVKRKLYQHAISEYLSKDRPQQKLFSFHLAAENGMLLQPFTARISIIRCFGLSRMWWKMFWHNVCLLAIVYPRKGLNMQIQIGPPGAQIALRLFSCLLIPYTRHPCPFSDFSIGHHHGIQVKDEAWNKNVSPQLPGIGR